MKTMVSFTAFIVVVTMDLVSPTSLDVLGKYKEYINSVEAMSITMNNVIENKTKNRQMENNMDNKMDKMVDEKVVKNNTTTKREIKNTAQSHSIPEIGNVDIESVSPTSLDVLGRYNEYMNSVEAMGIMMDNMIENKIKIRRMENNMDNKMDKMVDEQTVKNSYITKKESKNDRQSQSVPEIDGAAFESDGPTIQAVNLERRDAVLNAMRHAWSGYETYAFGSDELAPLSGRALENWGGLGTTLVDSLDTLWIMGLHEEFDRAKTWVRDHLYYGHNTTVNTFETTIRSLAGLLAAYDLSGDAVFLTKAVDLGDRLLAAFNKESGLPRREISLMQDQPFQEITTKGHYGLAEVASLQVEFRYLAAVTGNRIYATTSEKVFHDLKEIEPPGGLYPFMLGWNGQKQKLKFSNSQISFGGMGDSFYEYLLKVWIQGGKKESMYREMYDKSMNGLANKLIQKTQKEKLTYIAEMRDGVLIHKMDHLACFMGGLLALGAYTDPGGLESTRAQRDLQLAKDITHTCYQMYKQTPSGIGPEIFSFACDWEGTCPISDDRYILRPETVESLFILYHLTGDPIYRQWGWEIFQAIEKHCKTDIAYTSLKNVTAAEPVKEDKMESFFLSETLKYLYLLFDDDGKVDLLGKHLFNTEAHLLSWKPIEETIEIVHDMVW